MKTGFHLVFPGTCRAAFALYAKTFAVEPSFTMTFGEAPPEAHVGGDNPNLILHTTLAVGSINLTGCDAPRGREETLGGFQLTLAVQDEAEVQRLFAALSEGGNVGMAPQNTFWSPLFCMFRDRFGVGWMISVATPAEA
ncbi:VOC family protein [Granulicella cerasi]|uniref:VOC family protein n=1 Tax=Granulicella cerasi TaxID=741063 RepID=A0ABW1ZBA0_9BACT|nr:VOC family protein [Granulicella cerasi]